MRLLITGGAGFIGSNYINWHLQQYQNDEIVCLDKLTYAANMAALADVVKLRIR
ncbi:MAG: GDP-mannose 4,6-dehydratase [Acidaminococcaceae bacterium]|nr:GDP-mannose 4,6-dehydratase [Acidaminococcaceae bacterium]